MCSEVGVGGVGGGFVDLITKALSFGLQHLSLQ